MINACPSRHSTPAPADNLQPFVDGRGETWGQWFSDAFFNGICYFYNKIMPLKKSGVCKTGFQELDEILEKSKIHSFINDHLPLLFFESLSVKPKLIVELGIAGGESNFVFQRVARLCDAVLIGVDLDDCSSVCQYEKWFFIQKDDIDFADEFAPFCKTNSIKPEIDILFIDTSHYFSHTLQEIHQYFPFLSSKAKVFLHDTNLTTLYFRQDGSLGYGWNNQRGVIRALEVFFQKKFYEKAAFTDVVMPFFIRHYPHCAGLTVLEKIAIPVR